MNINILLVFFILFLFLLHNVNRNKIKKKGGENSNVLFNIGDDVKIIKTGNIGVIQKIFKKDGINLAQLKLNHNQEMVLKHKDIELIDKYNIPLDKDFIDFLKNSEWLNLEELQDNSNIISVKALIYNKNKNKTTEMINLFNERKISLKDNLDIEQKTLQENIIKAQIMDEITEYKPYDIYLYNLYDLYKNLNNFKAGVLPDNICKNISNTYSTLCKEPIISDDQYKKYLKKQVDKDLEKTKQKLDSLTKFKEGL